MPAPPNSFKAALHERRFQVGLWAALANAYTTEVLSGSGYDWLLIDAEHGPNDLPLISAQIAAAAPSHPIVRLPVGEAWMIKQVLDAGAQTLLIPMVESVAQAEALVRAVRYPPAGMRGVGAALGRASRFGRIGDYLTTADEEICLLLQIESRAGLAALDGIAALEGVDGIFIGPSDLAADMGHLGQSGAEPVQQAIVDAFRRIGRAGKARGIMSLDLAQCHAYRAMGADFMAIGADVTLLAQAATALRQSFLGEGPEPASSASGY
ncbi:aldolase/citrate lyase family protein [Ensifer soli]|uniref:aldolase/citrate lyase family protein n=1 Tax=Ciceribacter sp. sgz301302 TaxID=3342379 RepID=UPI0035BB4640